MRTRATKLSLIGAAIGLVLASAAIAPASAAQPTSLSTAVSTTSCGYFNGRTVTASTVASSGVALRAGDVITAKVAPARTGDRIRIVATAGLNWIFADAAATTGLAWRAPADGVYNLSWSLQTTATAPSSITWSFTSTCSTNPFVPAPTPTKPGKGGGNK